MAMQSRTIEESESLATGGPVLGGLVETFRRREFQGWVVVRDAETPVRVAIYVNESEVAATFGLPADNRQADGVVLSFRFSVFDLWKYTKRTDQVTIRANGVALPIPKKGLFYSPRTDGEFGLGDLQQKLDSGYIFGQSGRLQLSKTKDLAWQDNVMGLYDRVNRSIGERGVQAFFIYGTLLGAVREGGFIGHDLDFDCAYISEHRSGAEAVNELMSIAFYLIDDGFKVSGKRTCLHVSDAESNGAKIDLFHLYFDQQDEICFPFGVASNGTLKRDQVGDLVEVEFANRTGLVPAEPEPMVEHIYGAEWRTPDPGFRWQTRRQQSSRDGILTEPQVEEIYWADFYSRTNYTEGSTFAEYVLGLDGLPNNVIEIGCGDGRDVFAFGRAGRTVVGCDRSHVGTSHATRHAESLGLQDLVQFTQCDVNDAHQLTRLIQDARKKSNGGPVLFYMRFFLHSIPAETQESLMCTIRDASLPGDQLAAEFRTDRDEERQKVHGKHYRRFQNPQALATELETRFGFTVTALQQGNGFSPYRGEDPDLARLFAFRVAE